MTSSRTCWRPSARSSPRSASRTCGKGVFYAELVFASGVEVSARPSDAIALALRTGTPIYGSDGVLDDAGIAIPDEQEDEVEKFREFLDQISPEDFGTNSQ